MIDMVETGCSLVSHPNKLTFIIINLAIYLAEKTTTMHVLVTIVFQGITYILNARHSHVSQPKAASIGHHEEVWLHCPTHLHTYIHKNTYVTGSGKRYTIAHIIKIELLAPRDRVSSQL